MSVSVDIAKFKKKIENLLKQAVSRNEVNPLADEALKIIVRRTRLGYGVPKSLGERVRLAASGPGGGFSPKYLRRRQLAFKRGELDSTTRPAKLNLTFTGQMLKSTSVISARNGKIIIGPTGIRDDGLSNEDVARFNAESGRIYLNLSQLEFNQLLRFYRKQFTDLRKKLKLIK